MSGREEHLLIARGCGEGFPHLGLFAGVWGVLLRCLLALAFHDGSDESGRSFGKGIDFEGSCGHLPSVVFELDAEDVRFPDPEWAEREEPFNGLLAVGGDLSVPRLLEAYRNGIFPWPVDEDEPLYWWSPDPRYVLRPERLHVSRRLVRTIRQGRFRVTFDTAFDRVIRECGRSVPKRPSTWITPAMVEAYCELHRLGHARSAEAWLGEELVGGLYGVVVGKVFTGESMFHRVSDASKVAFVAMVERLRDEGFVLVDCQVRSEHMLAFGAEPMPRREFLRILRGQKV